MPSQPLVGTWQCSGHYQVGTLTLAPNPHTESDLTALGTWSAGPATGNDAGATLDPQTRRVHVWFNSGPSILYDVDAVMNGDWSTMAGTIAVVNVNNAFGSFTATRVH